MNKKIKLKRINKKLKKSNNKLKLCRKKNLKKNLNMKNSN